MKNRKIDQNSSLQNYSQLAITIKQRLYDIWDEIISWARTFRGKICLISLLLVILIPILLYNTPYRYYMGIFKNAIIFSIFAASWDLLSGVTGQVNFGHALSFGLGGYVTAVLVRIYGIFWFPSIIVGGIGAVIFGLVIGIPCLKLKGSYLALASMIFTLIIQSLFLMEVFNPIIGGDENIQQVPKVTANPIGEFFIFLGIMLFCIFILLGISNSNLGTIFKAIRDDPTSTEASGINITKYKLISFMISVFFGGIAGSLFVLRATTINPISGFSSLYSFYPIIMTVLGGIATISGGVYGAFFFFLGTNLLLDISSGLEDLGLTLVITEEMGLIIFSIIMILVIRFTDRGLMEPTIRHFQEFIDIMLGK